MLKRLAILSFLLFSYSITAQESVIDLNSYHPPKKTTDSLYFPYQNNIQLIVINNYDTWNGRVAFMERMQPRGLSWASLLGPTPKNVYIFRNKEGDIIKTYNDFESNSRLTHTNISSSSQLKDTDYINTTDLSLFTMQDYRELNTHLMFYGDNDKVGLINLKGHIVLPAIYDNIIKYQDPEKKKRQINY